MLRTYYCTIALLLVGLVPATAHEIPDPEEVIQNTSAREGMSVGPATIVNNYGLITSDPATGIALMMTGRGAVHNSQDISGTKNGVRSDNQEETGDVFINNRAGAFIRSTETCPGCDEPNAAIYIERRSRNAYIFNRGTILSADNVSIQSLQARNIVAVLNQGRGVINGDIIIRKTMAFIILEGGTTFNGNADLRENILSQLILNGVMPGTIDQNIVGADFLLKDDTGTWTIESDLVVGTVFIRSGDLLVNGSLTADKISVYAGAGLLIGPTGKINGDVVDVSN